MITQGKIDFNEYNEVFNKYRVEIEKMGTENKNALSKFFYNY